MNWLMIAAGGALGALSRAGIARLSLWLGFEKHFPWGTLIANALGCLLIGMAFAFVRNHLSSEQALRVSAFFITGYLGSLTTFSTFALQSTELFSSGRIWLAITNIGVSVAIGIACVIGGMALVSKPAVDATAQVTPAAE